MAAVQPSTSVRKSRGFFVENDMVELKTDPLEQSFANLAVENDSDMSVREELDLLKRRLGSQEQDRLRLDRRIRQPAW